MCAPLCATGGRPAATLAMSVAVSRASQMPPLIPTPPKCGVRNAECGMAMPGSIPGVAFRARRTRGQFRIPHSAFRIRFSPDLLKVPDVRLLTVAESEVPIQRRQPRPRALGPFDQHDGAVAHHVVEPQIPCLGRRPETVAVDVIDQRASGRSVLV